MYVFAATLSTHSKALISSILYVVGGLAAAWSYVETYKSDSFGRIPKKCDSISPGDVAVAVDFSMLNLRVPGINFPIYLFDGFLRLHLIPTSGELRPPERTSSPVSFLPL